jgi:LemA protein
MKALWVVLGVVGLIVIVLLMGFGSYVSAKNQMVAKDQDVQAAFSQIDVDLQRRADLIPNLVATVKGYTKEESTVLTNIANARAGVLGAPDRASSIQANTKLDVALGPFFRLQEQYPDLKSNEQFIRLSDELAGTENRITVARKRYNDTLKDYNIYVQQFPNSIWAGMANFKYRDEYFKGNPENGSAPKVDFNN